MHTDPEARENEVQFGPYRLAGPQGPLWAHHATVALAPKELGVLWQLVTHPGQVVSKAALFSAVWGETIVSDGALTVCVRRLRAALGEDAAQPRYIATVHRVGYRFIGHVVSHQDATATIDLFSPASNPQPPASIVVGREAELTHLHSRFANVLKGERQLVFVTGEAGIGKSALVEVFLHHLASPHLRRLNGQAQPQNPQRLDSQPQALHTGPWMARGQCMEHHGAGEAYLPVLEILGRLCRQPGGAHIVNVLRRMAPTWLLQLPALLDQADYAALQPKVAGATRERMLREMVETLEWLSAERPVVLLLEDVHWSDVSTIDLLSMLARRQESARVLVLATSRLAELVLENHPLKTLKQELVTRGQAAEIRLGGVPVAAVRQYVGQRLAGQGGVSELTALVYRRTEGHPLFMVQLTDYLTQGAAREPLTTAAAQALAAAMPQRLRELIEVQVARLTPEEQRVLAVGSVAGVEFAVASVAAALGKPSDEIETLCEQLTQREQFIAERGVTRWPDGTVSGRYGFRHALYQEVLYQRLSMHGRMRLHRQIGEREEMAYGEHVHEIAAGLALHFERGQDAARAVHYHTLAAQRAMRVHAHREALRHITSGLALVPHIADPAVQMHRELVLQTWRGVSLVNTRGFAMPEVVEAYGRAHDLSLRVADLPALAPVLFGLWNFWFVRAELGRAADLAHQLELLAQQQEETALQGKAHTTAGQTDTLLGNFTAAFAHFQQGLAVYDEAQHGLLVREYGEDAGVSSHNVMGSVCWILGFPDQARQHLLAGRQLAQRLAYPFLLVQNLWRSAVVLQCCGATAEMEECLATLLREAQEMPFWHAGGLILHGWTVVERGQRERGMTLIQQGMQAWRATGAEVGRPYYLALLAHAYERSDQAEAGLHSLEEALQLIVSTGERWWEAEIHRLRGALLLTQAIRKQKSEHLNAPSQLLHPFSEAEASFLKAIAIAREQRAKSWELRAVMSLVRLRQHQALEPGAGREKQGIRSQGVAVRSQEPEAHTQLAEAYRMLSEVYSWFTEGFDTKDLREAKRLLDRWVGYGGDIARV